MRGYLQRLAASAVRPELVVHPFVSTLFSGMRQAGIAEETKIEARRPALRVERESVPDGKDFGRADMPLGPIQLQEPAANSEPRVEPTAPILPRAWATPVELQEEVLSTQPRRVPARTDAPLVPTELQEPAANSEPRVKPIAARERATPVELQEEVLSIQPRRVPARADDSHPEELLLPRQPVEPETLVRRAQAQSRALQPEAARTGQRAPEAPSEPAPTEPLYLRVQPLVEEWMASARDGVVLPLRVEEQRLNPAAWPAAARQRVGEEQTPLKARRDLQGGSEDIQIHIGRIEVVAVQPAPARSATPARKSQTLDEYLKRRDGRAR